jgi:hypothetical protein
MLILYSNKMNVTINDVTTNKKTGSKMKAESKEESPIDKLVINQVNTAPNQRRKKCFCGVFCFIVVRKT